MRLQSAIALVASIVAAGSAWGQTNFPPIISGSASPDEVVLGTPVAFSSAGSFDPEGEDLAVSWSFGDGATSDAAEVQHTYADAGRYDVVLEVSDGVQSRFLGIAVTVLDPPALNPATRSDTLALAQSRDEVWVVNPDSDTVSVVDIGTSPEVKLAEIAVGPEPRTIALSIDCSTAYVACQGNHSLYKIDTATRSVTAIVPTGHMPYGVAVVRDDGRVLVSNQGSGNVTIYSADLSTHSVVQTGGAPRAIAVTGDGDSAYVSDYLTKGNTGTVWKIDLTGNAVSKAIALVEDTGPDTTSSGKGFPNLLSSLAIEPSGKYLWVGGLKSNTSRGLFSSGEPLLPDNRTRGVLIEIDLSTDEEILTHRVDTNDADLSSGIAFSANGRYLWVVHQGAEALSIYDLPFARTIVDKSTGNTVEVVSRSDVGSAPQGVLASADGSAAYVNNFLSRNLTVHDVGDPTSPSQTGAVDVTAEALAGPIANGKRMFYLSRAPLHSDSNYVSCASCHADGGMTDGRTWDFTQVGEGLRNTIDLRGKGGMDHGPVHWSANFDEIQDFENDIVTQFGGEGLAQDGGGIRHSLNGLPNAGRSQDLDDLAAYVSSLKTPPKSPYRQSDGLLAPLALQGRSLFNDQAVGCATCHAAPRFTDSTLTPDPANYVFHDVGTLLPSSGHRLGQTLSGLDTPSLLGVWATGPYLHDGRADTLEEVVTSQNPADLHGGTSHLNSQEIAALVAYLKSIDGSANDQVPAVVAGEDRAVSAGWLVDLDGEASDDGLPSVPGNVSLRWETNAGDATIEDIAQGQTAAVFPSPGNYTLTLFASDDGGVTWPSYHAVNVTVGTADLPPPKTYEEFKTANFTPAQQLDESVSGPDADPDVDQSNNLLEYFQSSPPKDPNSDSPAMEISHVAGNLRIRSPFSVNPIDASAEWFSSPDLINWMPRTPSISGFVQKSAGIYILETRFALETLDAEFFRLRLHYEPESP